MILSVYVCNVNLVQILNQMFKSMNEITENQVKNPNRIKEIITNRGFEKFRPTDAILEKIGITPHRFNKVIDNEVELTSQELIRIAEWLAVDLKEIYVETHKAE